MEELLADSDIEAGRDQVKIIQHFNHKPWNLLFQDVQNQAPATLSGFDLDWAKSPLWLRNDITNSVYDILCIETMNEFQKKQLKQWMSFKWNNGNNNVSELWIGDVECQQKPAGCYYCQSRNIVTGKTLSCYVDTFVIGLIMPCWHICYRHLVSWPRFSFLLRLQQNRRNLQLPMPR